MHVYITNSLPLHESCAGLESVSFLFDFRAPMCSTFVFAESLIGEVNELTHVLAFYTQRDGVWTCEMHAEVEDAGTILTNTNENLCAPKVCNLCKDVECDAARTGFKKACVFIP